MDMIDEMILYVWFDQNGILNSMFNVFHNGSTAGHSQTSQYQLHYEFFGKNHEMMKGLVDKLFQIYNRLDDFDGKLNEINKKLLKTAQQYQHLHHQFRSNYLLSERNNQQLYNDILNIKNQLGLPSTLMNDEDYLNSHFFREQAKDLNNRTRENKNRNRRKDNTNMIGPNVIPRKDLENSRLSFSNPTEVDNPIKPIELTYPIYLCSEASESNISSQSQKNEYKKAENRGQTDLSSQIKAIDSIFQRLEEDNQLLKTIISQYETTLARDVHERIQENNKKIVNLYNILSSKSPHQASDYSSQSISLLIGYIQQKLPLKMNEFISKFELEQSFRKVKEAWQHELNQIYHCLQEKASVESLGGLQQKTAQLQSKILTRQCGIPLKINHIQFKSTNHKLPANHHKVRSYLAHDYQDELGQLHEQTNKKQRQTLAYSTSASRVAREKSQLSKQQNTKWLRLDDEKKWKQNVVNILREGKIKRKMKHI